MELVYYWIEEWKNIKHQGFNLSSEYEFEFDKEKSKKNIEAHFKYKKIENHRKDINCFFGKNISNISLILGKNGTGKSNSLESFYKEMRYKNLPNGDFNPIEYGRVIYIFKDENDNFNCFTDGMSGGCPEIYIEEKPYDLKNIASNQEEKSSSFIYYDDIVMKKPDLYDRNTISRNISTQMLFVESDTNFMKYANNETIKTITFIKKYKDIEKFQNSIEIKFPKTIYLELEFITTLDNITPITNVKGLKSFKENFLRKIAIEMLKNLDKESVNEYEKTIGEIADEFEEVKNEIFSELLNLDKVYSFIKNYKQEENQILRLRETKKILSNLNEKEQNRLIEQLSKIIEFCKKVESIKNRLKQVITDSREHYNLIAKKEERKIIEAILKDVRNEKIEESIKWIYRPIKEGTRGEGQNIRERKIFRDYIVGCMKFNKMIDKLSNEENFVIPIGIETKEEKEEYSKIGQLKIDIKSESNELVEFLQEDILKIEGLMNFSYDIDMSSGERAMLGLFSRFYSIKKSIKKEKSLLFVLDEPEMFMHPEWQRKFLDVFIKFINNIFSEFEVQIILTSHSPFIASDLPKENIIMLDMYDKEDKEVIDGEQEIGNCKVEKMKIDTFGANIMDLYNGAFFLKSNFGEFSKKKIKKIIKDLTPSDSSKYKEVDTREVEYTLGLIGEPLIRNRLESMYNEYLKKTEEKTKRIELAMEKFGLNNKDLEEYLKSGDKDD